MVLGVIGYIPEYRGVTGTPPGVIGPHGPKVVEEERQPEVARSPPCPNLIWKREGGGDPLLLPSLHLLLPPSPSWNRKGGGNPAWTGSPSRTPSLGAHPLGPASPSPPLYTGARGHPNTHKFSLNRVRCPLHSYTPRAYHRSA